MIRLILCLSFCWQALLQAQVLYEGTATFRGYGKVDYNWMVQFLPYNPVIVQAGAYCGAETVYAAKIWPYGRVYAFEPNPHAFNLLQKAVAEAKLENVRSYNAAVHNYTGAATLYIARAAQQESSLLPPVQEKQAAYDGPKLKVPCISLDEWCEQNQIDHIDVLSLELEGLEIQGLEGAMKILKSVKLLIIESFFDIYRTDMVYYFFLKEFLAKAHFVPLAHWYEQGGRGRAAYVSQEMYDAYFVRCLGLGFGGLAYP